MAEINILSKSFINNLNMESNEILLLHFEEIRRRSIKLWQGITPAFYFWKPDHAAMHCLEMVRHVLEGEHLFHKIVENRGNLGDYISPWNDLPYTDVEAELEFAKPYRSDFLAAIKSFTNADLENIEIIRSEKGQRRKLGDYIQRIAYHEAVHTGQMLGYLRTLGIERPQIWD
jgi:uncharacterized damage-inducible protein DinB